MGRSPSGRSPSQRASVVVSAGDRGDLRFHVKPSTPSYRVMFHVEQPSGVRRTVDSRSGDSSRRNTDTAGALGSRVAPEIVSASPAITGGRLADDDEPVAGGPSPARWSRCGRAVRTRGRRRHRTRGRPRSRASPVRTSTRSCHPSRRTMRARKSVRVRRRSSRVTFQVGWSWAITRPGTPPPEPRSRTGPATSSSSNAVTNARACSITCSIGRAPRKPSCCDRRSTSTSSSEIGGDDGPTT